MEFIDFEDTGKCCSVTAASEYMNIPEQTVLRWSIVTWCPYTIENNLKTMYWPEFFLKQFDSDPQKLISEMENHVAEFWIPEDPSEVLFVVRRNKEKTVILERYSENYWPKAKKRIPEEDIIYITKDICDEKLIEFNFKTIIWKRFKDTDLDQYRKIIVPYTPENINLMKDKAGQIWLDYYMEELNRDIARKQKKEKAIEAKRKYIEARSTAEAVFDALSANDYSITQEEALDIWIEDGMRMPAPYIISDLKREQYPDLSWKQFKEKMTNRDK